MCICSTLFSSEAAKKRVEQGVEWVPRHFEKKDDVWVYKHFNNKPWDPNEEIEEFEAAGVIQSRKKKQ